MVLKELNVGHEAKCTCELCKGTGVYKGYMEADGLAMVCNFCNGKGYYTIPINNETVLLQDDNTGIIYKVRHAMIEKPVELFTGMRKRDDVEFVAYATSKARYPKEMKKRGATEANIISYEEFLNGVLPLPMEKGSCPREFTQYYGNEVFENSCSGAEFSDCPKFATGECWDQFYGTATTTIDVQNVLRKIR